MGGEATGESGYWLPHPDPETPEQRPRPLHRRSGVRGRRRGRRPGRGRAGPATQPAARPAPHDGARVRALRIVPPSGDSTPAPTPTADGRGLWPRCSSSTRLRAASAAWAAARSRGRPRGADIEPIRPLRATTVADVHILAQEMISAAGDEDERRLLVFADNRQDAAFQAGWMRDHARRYRLRYLMLEDVRALEAAGAGVGRRPPRRAHAAPLGRPRPRARARARGVQDRLQRGVRPCESPRPRAVPAHPDPP